MWQSWQPARTPLRFAPCTLARCSCATHCIEWQAVPQNLSVPVTSTITWVPTVAAKPMAMPMTSNASTDQCVLGLRSRRHVRPKIPPCVVSAVRLPFSLSLE